MFPARVSKIITKFSEENLHKKHAALPQHQSAEKVKHFETKSLVEIP